MAFQRIAVIMAGGSGERFWPFSRKDHPKQLLKLASPRETLIEQAVARACDLAPIDQVFVATVPHLVEPLAAAVPGVPRQNILAEPLKRNTAGCLVWLAANLLARSPSAREEVSIAVITADHRIAPPEAFARTVRAALEVAERTKGLVTIGIRPDRPETGFGYIHVGSATEANAEGVTVRRVQQFREKPDAPTAAQYVASGEYLWNSGTFFWTLDGFLTELEQAAPEHFQCVLSVADALRVGDIEAAEAAFALIPSISIDYALMERAGQVYVAEAIFEWDDVGSWDALDRSLESDANQNVTQGDVIALQSSGNILVSNVPGMVLTAVGVQDLVVAVTEDAVLIVPKDQAQDVKLIVEALKKRSDARI